jgi:small subunit ribosomal protein S6
MLDELRRYEMYIVFQPEIDDAGLETRIERVNTIVTGNNGEILEVARKGKRRLAYPIKRHNTGIDVIYQVNLPSRRLEIIERQLNLYEDVIRYLIVRDDHAATREVASKEEIADEVAKLRAQPVEEFSDSPLGDGDLVGGSESDDPSAPVSETAVDADSGDTDAGDDATDAPADDAVATDETTGEEKDGA